jgi:transposase
VSEYDGKQFVGIDLHRRHSVIVRQTSTGERLSAVRIVNDPDSLALQLEEAGEHPEVVLEATYGWYLAVDALQAAGATVHLAHPLGVKGFRYRRVKNDVRDAGDLADLLRMNRLPEAWIAPQRLGSCANWCATAQSSSRCARASKPRRMPCSRRPVC